jgi:UDP-N-acetylmuramoylalanine--D-glutamate ligase
VTFGRSDADYRVEDGWLTGPRGRIATVASMRRSLPHDITNALAASALVLESGLADESAVASALATFIGPPHRLEHIGTWDAIAWFNDSKATTPHAAAAAIRGFDRIVLIAGGYDKGVDLSPMALDRDRVSAVIAIGATAPAIAAAFCDVDVVEHVTGLAEAVALAERIATAGDTVLLSPGCASFDQYSGFEQRGDHFRQLVLELHHDHDDHLEGASR